MPATKRLQQVSVTAGISLQVGKTQGHFQCAQHSASIMQFMKSIVMVGPGVLPELQSMDLDGLF